MNAASCCELAGTHRRKLNPSTVLTMIFQMLVFSRSVDADNHSYNALFVHCRLIGPRLARPRVVGAYLASLLVWRLPFRLVVGACLVRRLVRRSEL